MQDALTKNEELALRNKGLIDLKTGERLMDGEGEIAIFRSYGNNAPLYVNLEYSRGFKVRIPNSGLKRV